MRLVSNHSEVEAKATRGVGRIRQAVSDNPMFKLHWMLLDVAILIAILYH